MHQADQGKVVALTRAPRLCVLDTGVRNAVTVRDICIRSAFLTTAERPPLGTAITLQHEIGGRVEAMVSAHARDGIAVTLAGDSQAAGFVLAVIAGGMRQAA